MPSVILSEAAYYRDTLTGDRVPIHLQAQVDQGAIATIEAGSFKLARFAAQFDNIVVEGLHLGEHEALALMASGACDCLFCCADHGAVRALVLAGLGERGLSLEAVLRQMGLPTRGLAAHCREAVFAEWVKDARVDRLQGRGLRR